MTVDTDQKTQEKFKAAAKIMCQLKQRDHPNKGNDDMAIPDVDEVLHMSSYPIL